MESAELAGGIDIGGILADGTLFKIYVISLFVASTCANMVL